MKSLTAVAALMCAALSAPAGAQDGPQAGKAQTIEEEVERIHRLVVGGFWKPAKLAITKFFETHRGDRRVQEHLGALEEDLRRIDARVALPAMKPFELLGRGAVKYDTNTGRAEFVIENFTAQTGWRIEESVAYFDALFVDELQVEVSSQFALQCGVVLGFGGERPGGYLFKCVTNWGTGPAVFLVGAGGGVSSKLGSCGILEEGKTARVTYGFDAAYVTIDVKHGKDSSLEERHQSERFPEKTHRRGFVALLGGVEQSGSMKVRGKLDLTFAKRQIAEADTIREQAWIAANWKREERLPEWVFEFEEPATDWADLCPQDCPDHVRTDLADLMRVCFAGAPREDAPKVIRSLDGVPGRWAAALIAYADRRYADAESAARDVMTTAPAFAPAFVLAAQVALRRNADEAADALAGEALKLDPAFAPAHDVRLLVAFRAGEMGRMKELLSSASAAGASTPLTEELRAVHRRIVRGPDWKARYESITPNFNVTGDVSYAVCSEVSKILEESLAIYGEKFRRRIRKSRGRVRVFSGYESYALYVSAIGVRPESTLGVYLPSLRELCVYLHEDRTELQNTIRHEAFHMFLHEFVDDAPIWFNEGYAEFFGFSRRVAGKAAIGRVATDQAGLARALLTKFKPVAELMRMEPRAFMADAGVHYVQSWALVQMLRYSKEPRLAGCLGRYFDALLSGRSASEAYDEVMSPIAAEIDAALKRFVESLPER